MAPKKSRSAKTSEGMDAEEFVVELLTKTLPSMRANAATAESPLFPKGISLIAVKAKVGAFGEVSVLLAGSDAPVIDPFSLVEASTTKSGAESE